MRLMGNRKDAFGMPASSLEIANEFIRLAAAEDLVKSTEARKTVVGRDRAASKRLKVTRLRMRTMSSSAGHILSWPGPIQLGGPLLSGWSLVFGLGTIPGD